MIKRFIIIITSVFTLNCVHAQTGTAEPADSVFEESQEFEDRGGELDVVNTINMDTFLSAREIVVEQDTILKWKKKKEFAYLKNLDSLLRNLQEKDSETTDQKPRSQAPSFINRFLEAPILQMLLIMLALFFVGVILYHLLKNQAIFKKASPRVPVREIESGDDEQLDNDYDKLLHQAYKLSDYRMAVRYLFLKTLQQLKENNLIEYAKEKTNSRYATEIPQEFRNSFSKLVLHYEYVWYGNFTVSKEQFEHIQKLYSQFLQKI